MALFFPANQVEDAVSAEFDWPGGPGVITGTGDFNGATAVFEASDEVDPTAFRSVDPDLVFSHHTKIPFTLEPCKIRLRIINSNPDNPPNVNFSYGPV